MRRAHLLARVLSAALLAPAGASWAGRPGGGRPAAVRKPVLVDLTPRSAKRRASGEYKTKLRSGLSRSSSAKVTTFGNDEISVQLRGPVSGRDVRVAHGS